MRLLEVRLKFIKLTHAPDVLVFSPQLFAIGCSGKPNIFCQVAMVVRYICPAALILHPVTLMIQSTQYKY